MRPGLLQGQQRRYFAAWAFETGSPQRSQTVAHAEQRRWVRGSWLWFGMYAVAMRQAGRQTPQTEQGWRLAAHEEQQSLSDGR